MADIDVTANALFTALTADADFTLPVVDLTGADYALPATTGDLYDSVDKIGLEDLTDRQINGTGVFDGVMETLSKHLQQEYDKGRITGQEYATAYVSMTQTALQASVQFLLTKDQSYWGAIGAQHQARAAEINVVNARVELETAKFGFKTKVLETNTMAADYALSKLKLATEEGQADLTVAKADASRYEVANMLPAQLVQMTKQNDKIDYELDYMLPKDLLKTQAEIDVTAAQISHVTAQKDQVLYTTSDMLPAQKLSVEAETDVKEYQAVTFLPAQVAGFTEDTRGKAFTTDHIMPAQLLSVTEQTEAHRAKTLDTRLDGTTPVAGAIGKQKALHTQQIDSYQRDAEAKLGKMYLDTWITQKSLDEGLSAPSALNDANINTILASMRSNLSI